VPTPSSIDPSLSVGVNEIAEPAMHASATRPLAAAIMMIIKWKLTSHLSDSLLSLPGSERIRKGPAGAVNAPQTPPLRRRPSLIRFTRCTRWCLPLHVRVALPKPDAYRKPTTSMPNNLLVTSHLFFFERGSVTKDREKFIKSKRWRYNMRWRYPGMIENFN
jgi:hypothetical protein